METKNEIRSLKELLYYISCDLASKNISKISIQKRLTDKILIYQILLRKVNYYHNKSKKSIIFRGLAFISNRKLKKLSINLGFTIPLNAFGPGLSIAHYGSIVVGGDSKIGKNCRIHSCVNIGVGNGKNPTAGDNVYIGPGAKIFGGIEIGDNVVIGANAVVNKDIPSNATVGGVPAKVVSNNDSSTLIIKGTELVNEPKFSIKELIYIFL